MTKKLDFIAKWYFTASLFLYYMPGLVFNRTYLNYTKITPKNVIKRYFFWCKKSKMFTVKLNER